MHSERSIRSGSPGVDAGAKRSLTLKPLLSGSMENQPALAAADLVERNVDGNARAMGKRRQYS
jgi:hypothetical protein